MVKKFYRRYLQRISVIREIVQIIKRRMRCLRGECQRYAAPSWKVSYHQRKNSIKFAVICDVFTWVNISEVADAIYLSANDWRDQMEKHHPDVFFCEATWSGIDGSWTNEIYRNHNFRIDNRSVLKSILKYCREAGIPTIFWNKEDTPRFEDKPFSFIDSALLFDHIFTTAVECISKYQAMGHKSVHLMMFGYLPKLFCEKSPRPRHGVAVFLGSWYNSNRERCEDMRKLFDMVLAEGLTLHIYDRVSELNEPERQFPERYRQYILPAVSYEQTAEVMNEADYVININSVKDSETMFARRVFEAMACGRIVISNESKGLQSLFPGKVWFYNQPFDRDDEERIIEANLKTVQNNYTFQRQLTAALKSAGIISIL